MRLYSKNIPSPPVISTDVLLRIIVRKHYDLSSLMEIIPLQTMVRPRPRVCRLKENQSYSELWKSILEEIKRRLRKRVWWTNVRWKTRNTIPEISFCLATNPRIKFLLCRKLFFFLRTLPNSFKSGRKKSTPTKHNRFRNEIFIMAAVRSDNSAVEHID